MRRTMPAVQDTAIQSFSDPRNPGTGKQEETRGCHFKHRRDGRCIVPLRLQYFNRRALAEAGEGALIPAYMVSISSFAVLFLTMFRACGILFGTRDMDLLASLPVKNSEIIGSKFLLMYLMNLLISIIFMIPGGIVWIADVKTDLPHFALFRLPLFCSAGSNVPGVCYQPVDCACVLAL